MTAEDHVQGQPGAEVTLVQDGDYECPYTRLSRHSVHPLQREFSARLRFVFLHVPLAEIQPHARTASMAAEAAGAQGSFWEMHEHLFKHQQKLENAHLHQYAIDLRLQSDRFDRDRASPEVAPRIDRDLARGARTEVEGTPTFYVNGARHAGSYEVESLRSAILAAISTLPGGIRE